jgi:hypothetical protein
MVVIRKSSNNTVVDTEAVTLFNDLTSRYPMAAAGLIHDLCDKLSYLLESESSDEHAIENLCETLSQIFRPIDQLQFPESYPWDAAYDRFGRWLMRGLPRNRNAVLAITGWSNEQMTACKTRYTEMVRIYRDDWTRAANALENQIIE